eukprot:jgi/Orpsp1_1/1177965/evm.model.c7180000063575.1
MTTDCDILRDIFVYYGIEPYWNESNDCLEAKGINVNNTIVVPDGSKQYIAKLKLREMNLASNFNPQFFELKNLIHLSLADNQISGDIPNEFSKLPNLIDLSLRDNRFTGNIPDLSTLTNLKNLFLQNNQFDGIIGDKLKNLNNLEDLYLHTNQLKGEIPDYIGEYSNMINITLSNNKFSGSIPSSFNNLKKILYFEANNLNDIKGPVPEIQSNNCSFTGTNVCYKNGEQTSCSSSLKVCTELDLKNDVSAKSIKDDSSSPNSNLTFIIIGLLIVVICIALAVIYYLQKKKTNKKELNENENKFNKQNDNNNINNSIISNSKSDEDNSKKIIENNEIEAQQLPYLNISNVRQSLNDVYMDNNQFLNQLQYNNQLNYMNNTNNYVNNINNYMNNYMTQINDTSFSNTNVNNFSNIQSPIIQSPVIQSPVIQDICMLNTADNRYSQILSTSGSPIIYSPNTLNMNSSNNIPPISLYSDNQSNDSNSIHSNGDRTPQSQYSSVQIIPSIQDISRISFKQNEIPNEEPPPYIESEENHLKPVMEKH